MKYNHNLPNSLFQKQYKKIIPKIKWRLSPYVPCHNKLPSIYISYKQIVSQHCTIRIDSCSEYGTDQIQANLSTGKMKLTEQNTVRRTYKRTARSERQGVQWHKRPRSTFRPVLYPSQARMRNNHHLHQINSKHHLPGNKCNPREREREREKERERKHQKAA